MRGARYVRLISWTLQSGSEQFIYNWNQTHADLDQGTGKRNGQGSNGSKRIGIKVVSKVTHKLSRQDNLDNGIKRMGLQVVSRVTCKTKSLYAKKIAYSSRGGLARSSSSRLCGYIQVTEKPTEVKILQ
jgi:hypothetical protein